MIERPHKQKLFGNFIIFMNIIFKVSWHQKIWEMLFKDIHRNDATGYRMYFQLYKRRETISRSGFTNFYNHYLKEIFLLFETLSLLSIVRFKNFSQFNVMASYWDINFHTAFLMFVGHSDIFSLEGAACLNLLLTFLLCCLFDL